MRPAIRAGGLTRRLGLLLVVAVALMACGVASSSYFDQSSANGEWGAATLGTHVFAGIGGPLSIQPGDRVQLLGLETGSSDVYRVLVAGSIATHGGFIGVARQPEMTAADLAGYSTLANQTFTSSDGAIAVLLEIVTPNHDVNISAPVLTFSVNGGRPQRERLRTNVRICFTALMTDPCPSVDAPS